MEKTRKENKRDDHLYVTRPAHQCPVPVNPYHHFHPLNPMTVIPQSPVRAMVILLNMCTGNQRPPWGTPYLIPSTLSAMLSDSKLNIAYPHAPNTLHLVKSCHLHVFLPGQDRPHSSSTNAVCKQTTPSFSRSTSTKTLHVPGSTAAHHVSGFEYV